jgi:DNA-binding XRE family transcriptional regulator
MDEWEIYLTDEVRDWIDALEDRSHLLVVQAIDILADRGPALGRPMVDHIEHSAIQNLKELRPASAGRSELRILFAFDPWRSAILLVAGEKGRQLEAVVPPGGPQGRAAARDLPERASRGRGTGRLMTFTKWSDIRDEHIERVGQEEFEAGKAQMLAEARGWRLAEIRRRRGMTQAQVAARMGVGKSRISQIEKGRVSTRDVLDRYVEALGGRLSLMADFGDELLRVG